MHPAFRFFFLLIFFATALLVAFPLEPRAQTDELLPTAGSNLKADEPLLTIEAGLHSASLRSLATDDANRILVTGSIDKTVRVWDLPTGRLLGILRPPIGKGNVGMILAVAVTPDGNTIACGGRTWESEKSKQIYFFDRESRRLLKRISGFPEGITFLRFSRDGSKLAIGLAGNGGLRVYSIDRKDDRIDAAPVGDDPDYGESIRGMDFDSAGRLAVSSTDGALRLYSREFRRIAKQVVAKQEGPSGVRFSPDDSRIALGYFDAARVDIFSAETLRLLESPLAGTTRSRMPRLMAVDWSPDGRYFYAAGNFGQRGKNVIIRWPSDNFHAPDYVPVKWTIIRNLLALRDGNLLYGGVSGDMALIEASGEGNLCEESQPRLPHEQNVFHFTRRYDGEV